MKTLLKMVLSAGFCLFFLISLCQDKSLRNATVPFILDHNRMLVEAEIQRTDGSWRRVRLWVDTGNPTFNMSEGLALDLGLDLPAHDNANAGNSNPEISAPPSIRIGGMTLNLEGVKSKVMLQPFWLFTNMHNDANLPSTVLKHYQVVFDYPGRKLTLAIPGSLAHQGIPSPAHVNPNTGIIQMDAVIDGDSMSFALDNGASYSFISEDKLLRISEKHPDWPGMTGTAGCANMWGWWPPNEQTFKVVRVADLVWGQEKLYDVGIVGVPAFSANGPTLGAWYSKKTARPVDGFLGPNAFKSFRVEIDYLNGMVWLKKGALPDKHEMDLVGLSVRQLADSSYQVVGVVQKAGRPLVNGVVSGDILFSIGNIDTRGVTMGTVVDALRGKPGEIRVLGIERDGKRFRTEATVEHLF
jgi:hypothetical protein